MQTYMPATTKPPEKRPERGNRKQPGENLPPAKQQTQLLKPVMRSQRPNLAGARLPKQLHLLNQLLRERHGIRLPQLPPP
jgi:hypothetical protein